MLIEPTNQISMILAYQAFDKSTSDVFNESGFLDSTPWVYYYPLVLPVEEPKFCSPTLRAALHRHKSLVWLRFLVHFIVLNSPNNFDSMSQGNSMLKGISTSKTQSPTSSGVTTRLRLVEFCSTQAISPNLDIHPCLS
jgi:hypothetical protein